MITIKFDSVCAMYKLHDTLEEIIVDYTVFDSCGGA